MREGVWVLVGRDEKGDVVSQGSAFYLAGVGLVTASHVFLEPEVPVTNWKLIRSSEPHDECAVQSFRHEKKLDLAVFSADIKLHAQLRPSVLTKMPVGQPVQVVGFPNWHSLGDSPMQAHVQIAQRKPMGGTVFYSVSLNLLSGASGGPVLYKDGHVVGVVVGSKDNTVLSNSFIEIHAIARAMAGVTETL